MAVFDLDSDKMQNLIDKEAKGASAPRDAAEGVLFIITSLNTAGIVRVVVFGSDGITEAASAEKMLIDMSSIEPVATREMGTKWVDAPRSGGAPKALIGQLTVIANATTHRPDASIIC